MNLFWKILGWTFLGGVVIFVLLIVFCLFLIDRKLNHPSCDSAEDVIEQMERYVEYDFDTDDYEVVDWWCWVYPDVQKGVTLLIKDEKAWNDIVKHFKAQKNISFSDSYNSKEVTISNSKDGYYRSSEYDDYTIDESFDLNYKTREIKYNFTNW